MHNMFARRLAVLAMRRVVNRTGSEKGKEKEKNRLRRADPRVLLMFRNKHAFLPFTENGRVKRNNTHEPLLSVPPAPII